LSTGAIIGIVVGSVAFVGLIVAGVIFYRKKNQAAGVVYN
jgi:outer membrane murein-binding lipoprotein Lpp